MNKGEIFSCQLFLDQIALMISLFYDSSYCQRSLSIGDFSHNRS